MAEEKGRSRVAVAPPFGMLLDLEIGFADFALVGIRDRERPKEATLRWC